MRMKQIQSQIPASGRYANYVSSTSALPSYFHAVPSSAAENEAGWIVAEPIVITNYGNGKKEAEVLVEKEILASL